MNPAQHDVIEHALAQAQIRRQLPSHAERRRIREAAAVSQAALALAIGVTPATISRWESAQSPRDPDAVERYVAALSRLAREGIPA